MKKKIANVKHINQLTWAEVKDPRQEAKVVYGKDFNYFNYKAKQDEEVGETVSKMSDLLAVGGTIYLLKNEADETGYELHNKQNRKQCIQYQMIQLDYLTNKFKRYIDNAYYKQLLAIKFPAATERQSIANASSYFKTSDWLKEKEHLQTVKSNVLDLLVEPILELAQDYSLRVTALSEQKRISRLKTEAAKLGVLKDLVDGKVYPNQSVTQPLSEEIDFNLSIGEFGPYISKGTNSRHTTADTMEAYLVNAWFFNNGFRVPTLDDQLEELETLRKWFETYKKNTSLLNKKNTASSLSKVDELRIARDKLITARAEEYDENQESDTFKELDTLVHTLEEQIEEALQDATKGVHQATLEKFQRLTELEVEVGAILDQVQTQFIGAVSTRTGERIR